MDGWIVSGRHNIIKWLSHVTSCNIYKLPDLIKEQQWLKLIHQTNLSISLGNHSKRMANKSKITVIFKGSTPFLLLNVSVYLAIMASQDTDQPKFLCCCCSYISMSFQGVLFSLSQIQISAPVNLLTKRSIMYSHTINMQTGSQHYTQTQPIHSDWAL